MSDKGRKRDDRRPLVEELEPRILLSANLESRAARAT